MTVRNFLEYGRGFADFYVTIFDNTRYDIVFDERNILTNRYIIDEIDYQGFGDYELVEFAIRNADGVIILELDIEMERE